MIIIQNMRSMINYKIEYSHIDYYERTMQSMEEARMINRGIDDYEKGKVTDGKSSLKKLREKYDI